jgi:hypothetical protein
MTDKPIGTYFGAAQANLDDMTGGRYGKITRPMVVGSTPIPIYPRQPGDSPSNQFTLMPPEPLIDGTGEGNVLGYALGEPHEQVASPVRTATGDVKPTPSVTNPPGGVGKFRRRI